MKPNQLKLFKIIVPVFLLLFMTCKETPKSTENLYPETELPVSTSSEEAMTAFVSGLEAADLGQARMARDLFDKALELDPNFVSAQMYRTFNSTSWKEFGDNRQKLLAMKDKANEAEKMQIDQLEANINRNTSEVLEIDKKLTEKFPNSARALANMAATYQGMDQTEKARELLSKALELNPDFIPAINGLGTSYLFVAPKDFAKAEKYMAKVVDMYPDNSKTHINLGDCYRAQKDLEKALASYLKAAELDPKDEVAFSKAGHANTFLGNFDEARKNYQDARAVSEFGIGSFNFEALTYLYEGDYAKTLAFFEDFAGKVQSMDIPESIKTSTKMTCTSNCASIAMHYGDADLLKKQVERMKPLSESLVADVGSESIARNQKVNLLQWEAFTSAVEGNFADAAAKAEEIKMIVEPLDDPLKLRPFNQIHAFVNFKQGNYNEALQYMASLDQDDVYNKYWIAKANHEAGNKDKAMAMFQEIADDNFNSTGYALVRNEVKEILSKG